MLRGRKAWILLLTFVLGCAQGVLSLAAFKGGKAHSASAACCATKSCPMRPAQTKTSTCHMAGSKHATSVPKMACSCSLSSGDSSLSLTAHFDFRFDLPRAAQAAVNEASYGIPNGLQSPILTAFTSPPDQPPENLT